MSNKYKCGASKSNPNMCNVLCTNCCDVVILSLGAQQYLYCQCQSDPLGVSGSTFA